MRRTLLLLATVALVLVLVGGVAVSQQQQEEQSTSSAQSPTTSEKGSSGDVTIQSTTAKASFTNGTGANFLGVKVSDHGNLISFESPANQEALWRDADAAGNEVNEGYVVCHGTGGGLSGHDTGSVEGGFGTATFSQPNGAGTFPLTVTRNTTDGRFQLKQVWATPDATEKDVTVTMTLKNLSSSTISNVLLARTGEFDVGPTGQDRAARTGDSVWQWDDYQGGPDSPAVGLMLTALTFGLQHSMYVEDSNAWLNNGGRADCPPTSLTTTPTAAGDFGMKAIYFLGPLSGGQSKTVKFGFGRM